MSEKLKAMRQRTLDKFKGIGEPLVEIPQAGLFVHEREDGSKRISITAIALIDLVEALEADD